MKGGRGRASSKRHLEPGVVVREASGKVLKQEEDVVERIMPNHRLPRALNHLHQTACP